ncbi:protein NUCLEAR FUSION DEFECTIVE 6, mitochondrial-like isoform X2 [Prosopis cineraria]|uniref:protein NUCLEAR FUSION DEFECTIVE 6, mitochondrial-like isoform X2 n=1 Tax=Prosopis cineraria TaxID=364024 RepID=UPI0024105D16|nr:protein NUCLEAR FUSION DEFECTIVE 6, mitochondrial-like isoform X2 [Prosopis cineraria]
MSAAARSFIRSAASRNIRKLDLATGARVSRSTCSPFSTLKQKSLSKRIFRLPVELSCCVEMMLPYHTATASALLTSMLSVSHQSYGWNPEVARLKTCFSPRVFEWRFLGARSPPPVDVFSLGLTMAVDVNNHRDTKETIFFSLFRM